MVWPFTMSFSAILCIASWRLKNGHAFRCSVPILTGYLLARVIVSTPINGEYNDAIFSAMWVMVATFIPLGGRDKIVLSVLIKVAIYLAVACVMWGRFGDYEFKLSSLPYVIADTMVIVAMLLIGWSLRHDIIDALSKLGNGISGVVGNHSLRSGGSLDDSKTIQIGKAGWRQNPPEVRRDG